MRRRKCLSYIVSASMAGCCCCCGWGWDCAMIVKPQREREAQNHRRRKLRKENGKELLEWECCLLIVNFKKGSFWLKRVRICFSPISGYTMRTPLPLSFFHTHENKCNIIGLIFKIIITYQLKIKELSTNIIKNGSQN